MTGSIYLSIYVSGVPQQEYQKGEKDLVIKINSLTNQFYGISFENNIGKFHYF